MICFSFGMFWLCSSMRNRWCQAYRAQLHGRDPEARFFRNLEIQDSPNLDHLVWEWKLLILLRFSSLMLVDIDPASAHGSKDPNGSKFGFRCRISGRKNFRSKFWGRWEAPIWWRDCVKPLLSPAGMIWCNWPTSEVWPVGSEKNGEHMEETWPPRGDKKTLV